MNTGSRDHRVNRVAWSRRADRWPVALLLMPAVIGLLASVGAAALTIGDLDPLYFPLNGANTGLTGAGPGSEFQITPSDTFLCAGAGLFNPIGVCDGLAGYQLTITQDLQTIHQDPQAGRVVPSRGNPFIGDSLWTATNTSGVAYDLPVVLLFTNVNLTDFPGSLVPGGYPNLEVGLDDGVVDVVEFSVDDDDFFYGAALLGPLASGETAEFLVRYIVNGELPTIGNDRVMPPLSVLGVLVPEPSTILLLVSGPCGLAALGRRRG